MGCLGNKVVDPEIAKLLMSIDEKVEDFQEIFIKDSEKAQKDLKKFTEKERPDVIKQTKEIHEKKKNNILTEEDLKNNEDFTDFMIDIILDPEGKKIGEEDDENNEEEDEKTKEKKEKAKKEEKRKLVKIEQILERINEEKDITILVLKRLNKIELEKEINILSNQVNKLHYLFELGLDLVEPLRKITLDKLLEKAKSAPAIALKAINKQIEEVKNIPIIEFFDSTYGKVLKDALAKKGMSEVFMNGFKNELMKEREKRRKDEKKNFNLEINVFVGEDKKQLNLDFMKLLREEYKDIKKNFKSYIRNKMIDIVFSSK